MVAVAPGARAQIGDIGAAARLGDRERRNLLARQHPRQHPRLNIVARGARNRRRADGVAHQARRDAAGTGPRQLLACHDLHELVGGAAAKLLGKPEAKQPDPGRFTIERAWKLAGLVPLMGERLDLLLDKAAHDLPERLVLAGIEWTVHRSRISSNEASNPSTPCSVEAQPNLRSVAGV